MVLSTNYVSLDMGEEIQVARLNAMGITGEQQAMISDPIPTIVLYFIMKEWDLPVFNAGYPDINYSSNIVFGNWYGCWNGSRGKSP